MTLTHRFPFSRASHARLEHGQYLGSLGWPVCASRLSFRALRQKDDMFRGDMNHGLDRRTFMRTSSLAFGASALGLRPLQAVNSMSVRTRKVKLGLVGCGGRGSWIAN